MSECRRLWSSSGGGKTAARSPPCSPLLAAIHGDFCLGYEHIGQHAAGDYHGVINQTIPAFPLEHAELAYELVRVGYRLTPRKRASCQQHERRRWLLRTG